MNPLANRSVFSDAGYRLRRVVFVRPDFDRVFFFFVAFLADLRAADFRFADCRGRVDVFVLLRAVFSDFSTNR